MSAEVSYLDREAAQRRAERIRFHATNANEAMQSLQKLVHQARELEDHVTLGYVSWTAYIRDLFGDEPLRLARDVRRELVAELAEAGMSTRAIAPIVGAARNTIMNDLRQVAQSEPPEPLDTAPLSSPARVETFDADGILVDAATGEVIEETPTVTEHTVTEKVKTVTGLDGKEYKRPAPKPREVKPVLAGEEADRANAIQTSKAVGQALASLERFQYENARTKFLSSTWPTGREEVQPIHRALVAPTELRKVAESLIILASEMESHDDYQ
ncbi:hypothetical protein JD276_13225 [Leucobacter sp. CSA1]|uniref:Uncharacterized protein n=1 Tax=Leucobacter chromiisoli TaxID=2796471 RepID=A0A934Q924_9MICO|nr:hypothetical protein [Leucobacter chromiisoli]MBK0419993.1 hypothetical protein [Leucobacter chromiisoli]